mgnify:CR=1 FL=1
MNARQILTALLLTGVSYGVFSLRLTTERDVRLIDVEESPRAPVDPDARTKPLVLTGIADRVQGEGNELRKLRNDLARRHSQAIVDWRAGRETLREVERLEQMLWVARHKVGEIDEATMHAHLAELFGREHERLEILYERGLASRAQVERAAMYVARERFLAGEDVRDAKGRDYETMRREYLERVHEYNTALIENGLGHREQLELDLLKLSEDFPPVVAK